VVCRSRGGSGRAPRRVRSTGGLPSEGDLELRLRAAPDQRRDTRVDLDGQLQFDLVGAQLLAEFPESPYGLCRAAACQVETVGVGVAGDLDDALGNVWWF